MRIKTQFIVTMLLFGVMLIGISASAIITNQRAEAASAQQDIATNIAQGASELGYLANDYVIYREAQQLERWQARFASFSRDVARLSVDVPEQQALARSIQGNAQRLNDVFNSVASATGNAGQDHGGTINPALLQVSWSRIRVQAQALASDASRLSQLLDSQVSRLQKTNILVVVALIAVFVAYFIMNYLVTQRRALNGLARLQAGAAVIGSGNLDFRIEEKGNDEIGNLSRAVNRMTADLKAVTASKIDLEKEIEARKKADEALRESEQKLSAIINAVDESIWLFGPDDTILAANETAARRLNLSPAAPVGTKFTDYMAPQLAAARRAKMEEVFSTGKPLEFEDERAGIVFRHSLYPVRDSAGKVAAIASFSRDITERKKAEEALQRYTQELEAANKELEAFSYSVSHDLQAPLRHIEGFSTILLEVYADRLDEQGRRYLSILRGGSQKMEGLIEALLGLSRVTRAEMHHHSVDLSQLAGSIMAELQEHQPERQVEFVIEPNVIANGDRRLLYVMLENLLGNAWKFTSRRLIARIEFGVTRHDGQHAYYVKDNGAGFDMAYADKLFGPFQRLHKEDEFPGTGIGLATVQRIIHRHGGRVWTESEIDKGATFYFTLRL